MTEPVDAFIGFFNDFTGVEKTLRFGQAAFGIASTIDKTSYSPRANLAKANIHLARRFFRAFKWVDCWVQVFTVPEVDRGGLHENIRMLRDSTLGMYFFLDMLMLPSELGAADETWLNDWAENMTGIAGLGAQPIVHSALVCWFYAIALTIVLCLVELYHGPPKTSRPNTKTSGKSPKKGTGKVVAKKNEQPPSATPKATSLILRELIGNCCDILVPATAVGYIKLDAFYVFLAMATASLISMNTIWRRIYAEKEAAP